MGFGGAQTGLGWEGAPEQKEAPSGFGGGQALTKLASFLLGFGRSSFLTQPRTTQPGLSLSSFKIQVCRRFSCHPSTEFKFLYTSCLDHLQADFPVLNMCCMHYKGFRPSSSTQICTPAVPIMRAPYHLC